MSVLAPFLKILQNKTTWATVGLAVWIIDDPIFVVLAIF